VSLGPPDEQGDNSTTDKAGTTNGNKCNTPPGNQGVDGDLSLLRSVGEVVVTGGVVVPSASVGHLNDTSVKVGRTSVQLVAVANIFVLIDLAAGDLFLGQAAVVGVEGIAPHLGLTDVSKVLHSLDRQEGLLIESSGVVATALIASQDDKVVTISLVGTLTGSVGLVEVATSPLEVHVVTLVDLQVVGSKVVLDSGVALHNVTTTTTHVQVDDTTAERQVGRTRQDAEDVRSVLEGTTVLVGVEGQGVVKITNDDDRVVLDGRALVVVARIDHVLATLDVSPSIVVTRRDVVTETEDAVLTLFRRGQSGDDPAVDVGHARARVTQMVVSVPLGGDAVGSSNAPSGVLVPSAASSQTVDGVVVVGDRAQVAGLDVLRLGLVEVAASNVRGDDGNVLPWGRVPVGVVVTLFRALVARSRAVVVLTRVGGRTVGVQVTTADAISSEETVVAATSRAVHVELVALVHAVVELSVGVRLVTSVVQGDALVLDTVTEVRTAHVLQYKVAVNVVVTSTATVLSSPFDLKDGSVVVSQSLTPAITTSGIVLGIHKSVLSNSISGWGIESVV
jgi:hypothetical protein